jgi:hypothetical protein
MLYLFSHVPSPFCFDYFLNSLSHFCSGIIWKQDPSTFKLLYSWYYRHILWPSYLCLLHSWNDRHTLPHLAVCWGKKFTNFLPGLASNCEPLNLCLSSTWGYRHKPPCLAACFLIRELRPLRFSYHWILIFFFVCFCNVWLFPNSPLLIYSSGKIYSFPYFHGYNYIPLLCAGFL